jgi:heme exporter protein B
MRARFLRHLLVVAGKDLRVEARSREAIGAMVFFAAMIVVLGSFAFSGRAAGPEIGAGVLWLAVAFAGVLGLSRSFGREREAGTLRALLLAPVSRGAVLLGKAAAVAVQLLVVELCALPLVGVLCSAPILAHPGRLVLFLLLVPVGYAVVGAVFSGMLVGSRAREALLPVVLYPILTPALLAGLEGTAALWADPARLGAAAAWLRLLALYDLAFLVVAVWAFELLVIE